MRRPVSWTGCVKLPMKDALKVQKETGYEKAYQQEPDDAEGHCQGNRVQFGFMR